MSDESGDNVGIQTLEDWKGSWPSEVYKETILSSGDVSIGMLMESCQKILSGRGIRADTSSSVAIYP